MKKTKLSRTDDSIAKQALQWTPQEKGDHRTAGKRDLGKMRTAAFRYSWRKHKTELDRDK